NSPTIRGSTIRPSPAGSTIRLSPAGAASGINNKSLTIRRSRKMIPGSTVGAAPALNPSPIKSSNTPRHPQKIPSITGGGTPGYNATLMQFAYDPDYVQYKLKKAFEDNWISANTK